MADRVRRAGDGQHVNREQARSDAIASASLERPDRPAVLGVSGHVLDPNPAFIPHFMDRRVHSHATGRGCVVTVRVTTLKGADAGAYYVEALPNYYLQSCEPRGLWFGDSAHLLGLGGEVDGDAFIALTGGMDPSRPERHLGRRYDDKSVRGFDVTCSAPKSVSVLFAVGDLDTRREVLGAHDAAVTALAGWIERHAHTRYRIGGEVSVVDAQGIVAAAFRQHTSRALDPQLHTHLVIANRVKSPDGRWLALDGRLIKHDQQSLSAIYHAGMRAELTRRLGVRWHTPEHGIAEIRDVADDVLAEFSSRTADVRRRIDDKLDRFVKMKDREPTPRERWKLEREAAIDSRPAKAHSLDADVLHAQWAEQVRQLGYEPSRIVTDAVEQVAVRHGIDSATAASIVDRAMASMSEKQSTWRPTELHGELGAAIPTDTALDAGRLVEWLDRVVDDITVIRCIDISRPLPSDAVLRRDGRPASESVLDRALTTQAIIDQEDGLIAWADRRLAYDGVDEPAAASRSAIAMNVAQAAAASAVAGYDDLVLVVGPAGTGKTTALAPAVAQLRGDGRAVFGVAPSATAAEVLHLETGVVADTLDKLLIEHRLTRPPDHRYDLPVGATVIVDEAGMMPTAKLAELADLADIKGWRVTLVGDPLQFSAVGRGGMFGLLVNTFGAIELDRVHRFDNEWERDASLRLRRGDVDVADDYETNGRLHGGTQTQMERASVARWWELRQDGRSQLLMAPTNEATERLNERCQLTRIRAGEVDPNGPSVQAGPYTLHTGDDIATRHNDRRLVTDSGDMVRNRATWTIDTVHPDGTLTATGRNGTVRLPSGYVAEHVELAYARTGIAAQGRTVQHGILYMDRATDVRNLYVPMTRGIDTNEAFIVTTGEQTAHDVFAQSIATDWIDEPAHARRDELNDTKPHRPGLLDGGPLRELLELRHEITSAIEQAERDLEHGPRERRDVEAKKAASEKQLADTAAGLERAHAVLDRYDRPLHRRKHEAEIARAKDDLVYLPRTIEENQSKVSNAEATLVRIDRGLADAAEVLRGRPEMEATVTDLDERLEADLRMRARIARLEQPDAAIEVLGTRPSPGPAAQAWDRAAGQVHQHQSAFDLPRGLGRRSVNFGDNAYTKSMTDVQRILASFRVETPSLKIAMERPSIEL